jgi:hypothetical protein
MSFKLVISKSPFNWVQNSLQEFDFGFEFQKDKKREEKKLEKGKENGKRHSGPNSLARPINALYSRSPIPLWAHRAAWASADVWVPRVIRRGAPEIPLFRWLMGPSCQLRLLTLNRTHAFFAARTQTPSTPRFSRSWLLRLTRATKPGSAELCVIPLPLFPPFFTANGERETRRTETGGALMPLSSIAPWPS